MVRALFLDIDGTLVDSNEFHVQAWDEAFHSAGYHVDKADIRSQIGKGGDQLIPTLLPGLSKADEHAIGEKHGEIFHIRYLHQVKAFPHAADLIEMLYVKGIKVVLASSAEKAEVDYYVGLLKIASLLTGTVSKDDVANSKPSGDIFAAALAQVFPTAAADTLAVGDTVYDVQSALRSGVKTIGLRSGGTSTEALAGAGAPYVYASVKELYEQFAVSPLQG